MQTWTTRRLVLRPAEERDISRLLEFRNDPEVTRWLIHTQVEPAEFAERLLAGVADPNDHTCLVEADGRVIGIGHLEVGSGSGQPGVPERSEGHLGYIFDPATAGQGYATETAHELLRVAFEELALRRVSAGCFADNVASARILEKIGMRRERHGIADSWHAELGWIDGSSYAILRPEWESKQRAS